MGFSGHHKGKKMGGDGDDDDESKNGHRKNPFKIGKRITLDQNRGQELKPFHENLEQKWGEFQKLKK